MSNCIEPGLYRHFKGGYVLVLFTAKHSDREEVEVVYKGLNNGKFYARPIESFCEIVTNEEGEKVSRFTIVKKEDVDYLMTDDVKSIFNIFCKK